MRVIDETEVASSYRSMGKKNKHKFRKSKENEASDSSDETTACGCAHVNKSISFNAMKKSLQKQDFGICSGCAKEASSSKKIDLVYDDITEGATGSDNLEVSDPTIWVCLQCGNQGCDKNSTEKHALKHFETPRSSSHSLIINTTTWTAWCYECNAEIPVERSKRLVECMEHLKKLAGVGAQDPPAVRNTAGPTASSSADILKGSKGSSVSLSQKVMGLSNLGNTCFFNAVMQNLIQTYSLENLLMERGKKGGPLFLPGKQYISEDSSTSSGDEDDSIKDLPSIEINLTEAGPLTTALVYFLQEMNTTTRTNIINPSALFGQVCKKAPMFKGNQQHDSHELLRHLLDSMRSEEIKRGQLGVLKYFKLKENVNPQKVDDDTKMKVRQYGRQVKHTFVDSLFGGCLISTVTCEECKHISQILEPFLDLSLPVMEEKPQRPNQMTSAKKKDSKESMDDNKDTPVLKGIEGAATKEVSKHMSKKKKKQAKKLAKRASKTSLNKVVPLEGKKEEGEEEEGNEEDGEEGDREEDKEEDTKDMEEERSASDADVEDNLESDASRYCQAFVGSTVADSGIAGSAENGVETFQSHGISSENPVNSLDSETYKMADHLENSISTSATEDVNVTIVVMPNGRCIAVDETENAVESGKEIPISNGEMNSSHAKDQILPHTDLSKTVDNDVAELKSPMQPGCSTDSKDKLNVSVHVEYINGPITNGYLVNGDASFEESVELTTAVGRKPFNYKQSSIGEQVISDVNLNVSEIKSSCISEDLPQSIEKLTIQDKSSEDSLKTKHVDVPVNTSHCSDSNDTRQRLGSMDSYTVDSNEKTLKTGNSEDVSVSFNVQYIKPSTPQASRPGSSRREIRGEGQKKSVSTLAPRYHPASHECSLESCLNLFTSPELLTGNNKFGCKNCTKLKHKQNPHKEKIETVYSNANKKYLIIQPPAVLTLHLKRFEQLGINNMRKLNRHVEFPFVLDLAPYCSALCQNVKRGQKKILYSLYGVVEHSGNLKGGHYTAYVKVRPDIGTLTNFLSTRQVSVNEYLHQYTENILKMGDKVEEEVEEDNVSSIMVPPGRWFHISDSRVNEVTEATVERAQAYLLFYERIY
ncbi:hypothetical protein ACJMK2_029439 [Sinanodonta woodiana]|uniref:ubiquitinyl hydrolase 1 n=1 Tax=Sinanodonta woodiana TaxID=1069815 RepID=A0ABD3XDS8_SINWO